MTRRKGYVFRVLFVHGLLLVVVLGVVFVSLRLQYAALRDQAAEEQRAEQLQAARQAASLTETYFRARVAELYRPPTRRLLPTTPPTSPVDAAVYSYSKIDRRALPPPTGGPGVALGAKTADFLDRVTAPIVAGPFEVGGADVTLLAAPADDGTTVLFSPVAAKELFDTLLSTARRVDGRSVALFDAAGRCFVGDDLTGEIDRDTADRVGVILKSLRSSTVPAVAGPMSEATVAVTVQTVALPGATWTLILVGTKAAVDEKLQPLVTRLVTWTALVAVAVIVVLASTASGLIRVRRRVEQLRQEVLNRDLAKARRIQLNWLPVPHQKTPYLEMAAENRPARHISGDFYNWLELPGPSPRTAIVLGDVTGHGLPAAFLMATTQMLVRSTIQRVGDPGECLTEVNEQLSTLVYNGQFVTMLVMVIDHAAGEIAVASAGQGPPLMRAEGQDPWEELPIDPQLVLGVVGSTQYETQRVPLPPAASLVLYTDGVTEATNEAGKPFGLNGLRTALAASASARADDLVAAVSSSLGSFSQEQFEDDVTLVALHCLTAQAPEPAERAAVTSSA